jgi:hypothetical protein
VQVTVVVTGVFDPEEMLLSPDLEAQLTAYLLERCKDLGAIERVRVFRKSPAGVATIRCRVPEVAASCITRFAATVMLTKMFTPAALLSDRTLSKEVTEDVHMKCDQVGVPRAAELTVAGGARSAVVPFRSSSLGRVAVACSSAEAAALCVQSMDGLRYAGTPLTATVLEAQFWGADPASFECFLKYFMNHH